ncbi:MAG TPA: hypothetical protein VHX92_00375 [Rhizomicrobium sp.]|nr:hypothetical protein [Rhizomicrobium sp.]
MSVEAIARTPRPAAPFAPQCPGDRNFFLALVVLTWAGIIGGFGLDMLDHVRNSTRAYPLIVHLHALLFVGWLVLLTTQLMLVRGKRLNLHRRLGLAAAWLIPLMVVVALATAWTVQRQVAMLPGPQDPQFISINLTDMLGFATLAGVGIALRRDPSAHKRLMLLSTFYLSTAGFARLWLFTIGPAGTDSFWGFFLAYNLGGDIAVAALGIYDLATRGRLHPAYMLGAGWIVVNELAAAWLYFSPGWKAISVRLLGLA